MSHFKEHPLYQALMFTSLGIGTKGMAIVLCSFFDSLSPEKQHELLATISEMAMAEKELQR
jgi:hypothetical protein